MNLMTPDDVDPIYERGDMMRQFCTNCGRSLFDCQCPCPMPSKASDPFATQLFTEEQGYDYATTETDAFMLLLADSEIDLSLVEAKMKDMECERDYARAIARQACELLAKNNLKVEYPPMPWDEDPPENNKAPELLTTLKGLYKTRCCACGRECENGCGSTECCGAVQEVILLEDAAACSSDLHLEWTLLFDTHDGRCHPTRINFRTPGTEADARRYGEHILLQHDRWLKRISQCYPTNPN